jgi:DNA-directed RNA polymerase specialized sigma24 family protein
MPSIGPNKELEKSRADFEGLLCLLHSDREQAGKLYLALTQRLERFFAFKGYQNADELLEQTLDILAKKATSTNSEKLQNFAFGIARNTGLAAGKRFYASPPPPAVTPEQQDIRADCLEECLAQLPPNEGRLITSYYLNSGPKKMGNKLALAEALGLSLAQLATKAFNIRCRLRFLIQECEKRRR